jgi:hypothetical protein
MNAEERKKYKARKQKEYRARARGQTVDKPESVDNRVDNVTPLVDTVTEVVRQDTDFVIHLKRDPKLLAEATLRAERAQRYAQKMPEFIRPGDQVFQTVDWQYTQLAKYAHPNTPCLPRYPDSPPGRFLGYL